MPFSNDCLDSIGVCPNRLYALSVGQCCSEEKTLQLINPITGATIDLTQYGIGLEVPSSSSSDSSSSLESDWCCENANPDGTPKHGVEIIIKETPTSNSHRSIMAYTHSQADAELGVVRFSVTPDLSDKAGVWLGMALVWQEGVLRKQYPFYFDVLPNLSSYSCSGPITIYELRLAIRDMCPAMNFLIDTVEFKDEEIYWAIRRPIEYWNEVPPPVTCYTPMTFPFRYHWLDAVIGELLGMVALWMRRNDLDYTAGGLAVEDTKKWPDYMKMSQQKKEEWKKFVHDKKIEINLRGAYASLSGYDYMVSYR